MGIVFKYADYALRDIEMSDAPQLFERFTSKPRVMRYLPIKVHGTVQDTEKLIAYFKSLAASNIRVFAISHTAEPSRLVGTITTSRVGHAVALSIQIAPDRFSMGAGCKLAPQFVHFVLAHPGVYRVWAYTDVANKGVQNLLTHIGARCEGVMRRYAVHPNISDEPRNCLLWSMTK